MRGDAFSCFCKNGYSIPISLVLELYERYDICLWTNQYFSKEIDFEEFKLNFEDVALDYDEIESMQDKSNISKEYLDSLADISKSSKLTGILYGGIHQDNCEVYFKNKDVSNLAGTVIKIPGICSTTISKEEALDYASQAYGLTEESDYGVMLNIKIVEDVYGAKLSQLRYGEDIHINQEGRSLGEVIIHNSSIKITEFKGIVTHDGTNVYLYNAEIAHMD